MRKYLIFMFLITLIVITGCTTKPVSMNDIKETADEKDLDWKDIELKDVKTGEKN